MVVNPGPSSHDSGLSRFRMRGIRLAGAAMLGAALILPGTVALAADNSTPDLAIPVTSAKVTGMLPASTDGIRGQFSFYEFYYDGLEGTASINLQMYPADGSTLKNAGFRVYGPRGGDYVYSVGDVQTDLVPNISGDLKSRDKGLYLIQVYNYNRGVPINFQIWVNGLSTQPTFLQSVPAPAPVATAVASKPTAAAPAVAAPVVAPTPVAVPPVATVAPVPVAPVAPTPAASSTDARASNLSGHLLRGTRGHFDTYELSYPGDQSVYTINMQVFPDDAGVLRNVGFKVYDPTGKVAGQSGAQQSLKPNVSGNLISGIKGTFVVQVYNYDPDQDIDYTLSLVLGPKEGTQR